MRRLLPLQAVREGVFVMSNESKPTGLVVPRRLLDRRGQVYQPTVGPRLQVVLFVNFALFALLGANGAYLASLKVLNWWNGGAYENWFYLQMFFWHLALGFLMLVPFAIFMAGHLPVALKRPNRKAVKWGLWLLAASVVLLGTGVAMVLLREWLPSASAGGRAVYWLHVLSPFAAIAFYLLHRLAGPIVQWRYARAWAVGVAVLVLALGYFHHHDPRQWGVKGAGEDYFFPSAARTVGADGGTPFIPANLIDASSNQYCLRCHQDAYAGWFHSAHHFSSFNNLAYRQSIVEMRKDLDRIARETARKEGIAEGTPEFTKLRARKLQGTRWCAGCHDPVPFFTGAFDDDKFFADLDVNLPLDGSPWKDPSVEKQPTAHAGLTCVSCHAITNVNSVVGNADYTIQAPLHYPFAQSDNPILQEINSYLVKAKPDFHKRTFLKPFHRTAEFCNTCHKVHLPEAVNDYKWTRGQNHYDSWHASGASGYGARSFYHPAKAKNCADCHMPLTDSRDFGNLQGKIHSHLFPGGNTGLPALRAYLQGKTPMGYVGDEDDVIRAQQAFLKDKKVRVDLFALLPGGDIEAAPQVLRPQLPALVPGQTYLLEVVVRNLAVGHEFTQGTADSNELWLEIQAATAGQAWAENGRLDPYGYVDPWGHFVNSLILDRHGNRIDRRNAKDIFVPLFNHQIGPSSAQVVHYRLTVPADQRGPVALTVRLNYRKFDRLYQDFFMGRARRPQAAGLLGALAGDPFAALGLARVGETHCGPPLPITVLAEDTVTLPVQGGPPASPGGPGPAELWERWNDYGIGLLLQGDEGAERGLLKQAERAFRQVTALRPDYADGFLNLARVYLKEGRQADTAAALDRARAVQPGYFKTAWLRADLNLQNGRLDEAAADLRGVLGTRIPERGFDFSKDRELRRMLGDVLYQQAQLLTEGSPEHQAKLREAIAELEEDPDRNKPTVLNIDPEDRRAHYLLHLAYQLLGDQARADKHLKAYKIYEVDNNARDFALRTFRLKHPWADHAAQAVVIYDLRPPGAPPPAPAPLRVADTTGVNPAAR
jgi:hypothetical protein